MKYILSYSKLNTLLSLCTCIFCSIFLFVLMDLFLVYSHNLQLYKYIGAVCVCLQVMEMYNMNNADNVEYFSCFNNNLM